MTIKRIYVRHYRDSGEVVAYVEWSTGSRTEATLQAFDIGRNRRAYTFGSHMHALMKQANRQGLKLEREVW